MDWAKNIEHLLEHPLSLSGSEFNALPRSEAHRFIQAGRAVLGLINAENVPVEKLSPLDEISLPTISSGEMTAPIRDRIAQALVSGDRVAELPLFLNPLLTAELGKLPNSF